MKNPVEIFSRFLLIAGIILVTIIILTSCKLFREVDKKSSGVDSASSSKEKVEISKGDSTGGTKEKLSTKETVYYPQPIIVKGDDGKPYPVFVPQKTTESISEKEEWYREQIEKLLAAKQDTSYKKEQVTEKHKEEKAGTDWLTIAMIIGIGLLVLKQYLPLNFLTKINKL